MGSTSSSPTSYQVLSIPESTGKIRAAASAFPASALKQLQENGEYKSIYDLFQFPGSDLYKGNIYQYNWDSVGSPLAFFVPKTEEDISAFFRFYNEQVDLQKYSISIAAGRHSNLATLTDSLVVDMKQFKKTDVRKEEQLGYFGSGLKLGEFDAACAKEGLATTAGTNPDTGITGLILGGGFGYLARRHGLACDNVLGARVVLPNGEIITVNGDNEHKDLLWGLRGGGGNFGVVTEWTVRLHPQGDVYGGACIYILREPGWFTIGHRAILQQWREIAAKAPNTVNCMASLSQGALVLPYSYTDSSGGNPLIEGEKLLADAKKIGNPLLKFFNVMPYSDSPKSLQWQALPHQQAGNYYETGLILREVSDGAIDVLLKYTTSPNIPNKKSHIVLAQLGGKISEFGPEHSAFNGRTAVFWILVLGQWESATTDAEYNSRRAAVKKWVMDIKRELEPWLVDGTYNTLSSEEAEAKEKQNIEALKSEQGSSQESEEKKESAKASEPNDYLFQTPEASAALKKRLIEVKRKYDPKNLLRNNKNINPNEIVQ